MKKLLNFVNNSVKKALKIEKPECHLRRFLEPPVDDIPLPACLYVLFFLLGQERL